MVKWGFRTILGSIRGYFLARDHFFFASFHFGMCLGSFWHRFELIFGPFWCVFDPFGRLAFLGQKTGHFGVGWVKKM